MNIGRDFWKNFGVLTGTVLLCVAVSALLIWFMVEWMRLSHSESARLFQAVGAVTVIFVGGVFAYWRLQIFRTFEPHLTISHEISHRAISQNYMHIFVTAKLHNSSKVKIELREAFFSLQLVSPIMDEEMERLYTETFVEKNNKYIQWRTLDETQRTWIKNELIIEPSESHQETCEFILFSDIESVVIYTYFYNSLSSQYTESAEGWSATTVYDIVDSK